MERHRWLWAMGTALGLQMTMMPSSIAHISFLRQSPWLETLDAALSQAFLNEAIMAQVSTSSQRQTNTVTVDRADLSEPHILTIETSAEVSGDILINGDRVAELTADTTQLDVAPYLTEGSTTAIAVTGTYFPHSAGVRLQFDSPSLAISQQMSGVGRIDYRLNLEVD
ncbi:MAG: hypothetical protein F6K00_18030 [Leptolyngbya sp. SIOISBB]|nr:hypothetical protein [Leptolyngbya sp. SIOISBB]